MKTLPLSFMLCNLAQKNRSDLPPFTFRFRLFFSDSHVDEQRPLCSLQSELQQMPMPFLKVRSNAALLAGAGLLLLCGLFFWQLDAYSLFNITEAKQAEIARHLWVSGDWVTPVYNRELYFDKPVLLHWLMALGFSIFGINEWAVRLPSAVAAAALIWTTWGFVHYFSNLRTATLAATLLAANSFTLALGRTGQHDMLLTVFMTTALYCWYFAYSSGQTWGYLAFFALLALAVMAKGPLALVLCSLIIGIFCVWVDRWRSQLRIVPWGWGALIFGSIALPWHILMFWVHGWTFIDQTFLYNNVSRYLHANLNQAGPWYYYLPLILVAMFPWITLLPVSLARRARWRLLRSSDWRTKPPAEQLSLFMTVWFLTVLVFMSAASTKLPWYVYPGFPALAYLCAQAWAAQIADPDRWLKPSLRLISGICGLLAIGFAIAPRLIPEPLRQSVVETHISWLLALGYAIVAAVTWLSSLHRRALWAWIVQIVVFGLLALTVTAWLIPVLDHQILGGRLLPIAAVLRQETCNACSSDFPAALAVTDPSLNFYSQLSYIHRFTARTEIEAQLKQPQRLLLVTSDAELQRLHLEFEQPPVLAVDRFKLFILPGQTADPR
jgi:4-amino-4-deoxy-L-arabinose transferase-like glycosyltransferase